MHLSQGTVTTLKCPLCQRDHHDSALQLHEIVGRYLIGDVDIEILLPIEAHMLICADCNMTIADSDEARFILFQYSAELWGAEQVLVAMRGFNQAAQTVLSPHIVPYKWLKEQVDANRS